MRGSVVRPAGSRLLQQPSTAHGHRRGPVGAPLVVAGAHPCADTAGHSETKLPIAGRHFRDPLAASILYFNFRIELADDGPPRQINNIVSDAGASQFAGNIGNGEILALEDHKTLWILLPQLMRRWPALAITKRNEVVIQNCAVELIGKLRHTLLQIPIRRYSWRKIELVD